MKPPQNTQVKPYTINEIKPNSFIFAIDNALTPEICQNIVARFEACPDQQYQGRVGQLADTNSDVKRSTDLVASGNAKWRDVDQMLHRSLGLALRLFRDKYPFFHGPFKDVGYNIQRTQEGEHYHWHIDGGSHQFADRQLVALWYLNDVPGPGGQTEFLYQDVKITPSEGKLILFPPFWSHEHRGVTLEKGVKYIATTWVVFAE
ncbi:MAG: 2OG-Fe(II) oxygenase [Ectothiorhodospiraceae bacterium]|nr:2OG-Fe(II) oxygenase [Ectothiorhodospiraceae bacterium]